MSSGLKDKLKKTFFLPFWLSKGKKKDRGKSIPTVIKIQAFEVCNHSVLHRINESEAQ